MVGAPYFGREVPFIVGGPIFGGGSNFYGRFLCGSNFLARRPIFLWRILFWWGSYFLGIWAPIFLVWGHFFGYGPPFLGIGPLFCIPQSSSSSSGQIEQLGWMGGNVEDEFWNPPRHRGAGGGLKMGGGGD